MADTSGPFLPNFLFIVSIFCFGNEVGDNSVEGAGQNKSIPGQILKEGAYCFPGLLFKKAGEIFGIVEAEVVGQLLNRSTRSIV